MMMPKNATMASMMAVRMLPMPAMTAMMTSPMVRNTAAIWRVGVSKAAWQDFAQARRVGRMVLRRRRRRP